LVQIGATKIIWVITHPDVIRHMATTQSMKDIPKEIPMNYTIAFSCSLSKSVWQRMNKVPEKPKPKEKVKEKGKEKDQIEIEKEKIQKSRTIKISNESKSKKWCRKCKHEICICDEFNASLDSNCRICNIVPCMCIKITCESCCEIDCDCEEMQSDFAVRSSFDVKLYK
jgi:hypothetical protein